MDEREHEGAPDHHTANSVLQPSDLPLKVEVSSTPPQPASKQEAMSVGLRRDLAELTGTLAMNVPLFGTFFAGGSARASHAQSMRPSCAPADPALDGRLPKEPRVDQQQDSGLEEADDVLDKEGPQHNEWPAASNQFRQVLNSARHDVIDFQQQIAGEISRFAISVLGMSTEDDEVDDSGNEDNVDCMAEACVQACVEEGEPEDLGVTEEVLALANQLASNPKVWLDFPYFPDSNVVFEMSAEQEAHRAVVLLEVPALQSVMEQLCPSHISHNIFWMIYFTRMHSQLGHKVEGEHKASPPSSMLRNPTTSRNEASMPDSCDQTDDPAQPASSHAASPDGQKLGEEFEELSPNECPETAGEDVLHCKDDPASKTDAELTGHDIPGHHVMNNHQDMQDTAHNADNNNSSLSMSYSSLQEPYTSPPSSPNVGQGRPSEVAEDPAKISLWKDCTVHDDKYHLVREKELARAPEVNAEVNVCVENVSLEAHLTVVDDSSDLMEQLSLNNDASSCEENDFVEVFSPSKSMNRENSIGWLVVDGDDEC